jgi:hypothetical protein
MPKMLIIIGPPLLFFRNYGPSQMAFNGVKRLALSAANGQMTRL